MKNLLLSTSVLLTSAICSGQTLDQLKQIEPEIYNLESLSQKTLLPNTVINTNSTSSSGTTASGTVIFHETFGNGLNGDGSNGNWTNSGTPSNAKWEYRGTSTTPSNSTGSRGAWSGSTPINSTTRSNGFMIFDSDYLATGGSQTGTGIAPPPHTGYLTSPAIDLSSTPNLVIELTNYYRRYQGDCLIEFSTNGGNSWNHSIYVYGQHNVDELISPYSLSPTKHTKALYVPSGVGGNANVKFRLKFDGATNSSGANGYYFWMVDDIRLIEAPQNDLSAKQIFFNYPDSNSKFYNYAKIPLRQAQKDTVRIGHSFINMGTGTLPNVKTKLDVITPTGTVTKTSSSSVSSLATGVVDSLFTGTYTPTAGIGNYTYKFYTTSDSIDQLLQNDTIKRNFEVTTDMYAWSTVSTGYSGMNASNSYEVCSYFRINVNDTVKKMTALFAKTSNTLENLQAGNIISFRVFNINDLNSSGAFNGTNYAEYNFCGSKFYSVTPKDTLTNPISITVPMTHTSTHPTLTPGGYLACFKSYNSKARFSIDFQLSDTAKTRPLTTFLDVDDQNTFGYSRRTVPNIYMYTSTGFDSCKNVNITPNLIVNDNWQKGSIYANASGGTAPYCYNWTTPKGPAEGDSLNNLKSHGKYTVTITDFRGCTKTESANLIKVSVDEKQSIADDILFYPNPSQGSFTVLLSGMKENAELSIKNMLGQVVFTKSVNASYKQIKELISLDRHGSGIYIVNIKSESGSIYSQKVIIQ